MSDTDTGDTPDSYLTAATTAQGTDAEGNVSTGFVQGAFNFSVEISDITSDSINQSWVEVSGVVSESDVVEYMAGTDQFVREMPARPKFSSVELTRVYNGLDEMYNWRVKIEDGAEDRRTVTIRMLNLNGTVRRSMTLVEAWPKRWAMPTLNSMDSGAALEKITLSTARVIYNDG